MFVVVVVAAWFALAVGTALCLGGAIRTADRRAPFTDHLIGLPTEITVDVVLSGRTTQPSH